MELPARKPNRLKNFDYSTPGAYFITVFTHDRRRILSRIELPSGGAVGDGVLDVPQVDLTACGRIVDETIREIDRFYGDSSIDKYVIMPNHIHLLICITEIGSSGTPTPTNARIPAVISYLKRATNRQCGFSLWQRSYYDHIIRGEEDHRAAAEYIDANPARWREDEFYTET